MAATTLRPGRYRHFKGNEYEVIGIAKDSESSREFVVYRALYGERGLWIRPLEMFAKSSSATARAWPALSMWAMCAREAPRVSHRFRSARFGESLNSIKPALR